MGFTRSKPERVNEDFDTHREGNKNGQNRNDSHQPATEPTEDSVSAHTLDEEAATIWIYPTNAGSIREYQLKIVEKALFTNTLVALPTGLGKTFIAAVVMYNFYRWFPTSKAIFMAPTRPLVAQQIEACFRITGISQKETVEMTGTMPPEIRRLHWMSNFRVYFLTPQTLLNDLQTGLCPKDDICLLVVDEAHRSTGNHAYAEVIRALPSQHFRVLALTATPGSDTNAVQEVVKNLRISGIELRTEESPDIQPYTHERKLDIKIITPSKEISAIKDVFVKVVGTFLDRLCAERVYYDRDPMNASRYQLMLARTKFREQLQQNGRNGTFTQDKVSLIEGNFAVAMSLHGIQNFYSSLTSFIDETKDQWRCKQKFELTRNESFNLMMQNISQMLKQPNFIGHPKLTSTVEIIVEHFRNHEQSMSSKQNVESNDQAHDMYDTRAIIFSSFRESVEEITALLQKQSPLVRAMSFIGQASGKRGTKGLKQQEQLDLITKFQNGKYNVLVCTSIGEEGLDIGNVDLIVCFDAQNSPIRMLQRMGRTGRKREGKVVLLLSAGREEDCYKKANASYKLVQRLMQDSKRRLDLYPAHLARMLPPNVKPQKVEMALDLSTFPSTNQLIWAFEAHEPICEMHEIARRVHHRSFVKTAHY
ncbi:P-loop containing nucleoside triphosphate hydrolase protein [Cladochytrium replicatum]|nr:P-loop containing nucleoside triphosphate hydrolase protein [Cladochytrium replicatum]